LFDTDLITENRRSSALKKDLTPLRIDKEAVAAIFCGSEGNLYETSLDGCSCPDFAINGFTQPCKHMIRLAMEIGKVPSEGLQTDIDAVRGKYYLGKAKEFVHEADLPSIIQFAKDFLHMYYHGVSPKDDAFSKSMDLATLSDFPCFKISKRGIAKVEKGWSKDCEGLVASIRNRLGNEVIQKLGNDEFISVFCKGE
jgi:predicted nucleic acid-binding Zn finger protein